MRGISSLGISTSPVFFCSDKSEDKCRSLGMKQEAEYDGSCHNKEKVPHRLGWRVVINIRRYSELFCILNPNLHEIRCYIRGNFSFIDLFRPRRNSSKTSKAIESCVKA